MKLDLHIDRFLPHPVERVWAALTDRDALAAWLFDCDFRPEVGHRFVMRATPPPGSTWRGWTAIEVLELVPPTRMVWSWESADIETPTRVVFELAPVEGGTRLKISHTGDTTEDDIEAVSRGWPAKLDALAGHLGPR